jgi:hypothetical protein
MSKYIKLDCAILELKTTSKPAKEFSQAVGIRIIRRESLFPRSHVIPILCSDSSEVLELTVLPLTWY